VVRRGPLGLINIAELTLDINSFVSVFVMIVFITLNRYSFSALLHGVFFTAFIAEALAQLVDELRYKPESHGFDSRYCHWHYSLT
jgi:hypothetical protein